MNACLSSFVIPSLYLQLSMKVSLRSRGNSENFYFVSLDRITISFALITSANLPSILPCFNRESMEEWHKKGKDRYKQGQILNKCDKEQAQMFW